MLHGANAQNTARLTRKTLLPQMPQMPQMRGFAADAAAEWPLPQTADAAGVYKTCGCCGMRQHSCADL